VLKPSSLTERVGVTAAGEILQTESVALGRVGDDHAIEQGPLSTRNFTQLLTLSPGTSGKLNDAAVLGPVRKKVAAREENQ